VNKFILLSLLLCGRCFGGSLSPAQMLPFFQKLASPVAAGSWVLLTNITVGSTDGGVSCTTPGINSTNGTLIVIVQSGYAGVNTPPAPTSSPSETWHLGVTSPAANLTYSAIYWATNLTTTADATHTFSSPSTSLTFPAITVYVFGVGAGIGDQTNANQNASSATIQVGAITPLVDNELIIAGGAFQSGSTATINSAYSTPSFTGFNSGQNVGVAGSYLIQNASGVVNPTITFTGASAVSGVHMSFKR
jgi:hypothetical protein